MSESSTKIAAAAIAGYENLTAWADLLDRINVFPVADGDTGMNLRVSLAPILKCGLGLEAVCVKLETSGRGNSGNIGTAFFREFLCVPEGVFTDSVKNGRDRAWQAMADPRPGTMLGIFDVLCSLFEMGGESDLGYLLVRAELQKAVLATVQQLPELADAGVVDSGALGMFCFFDAFFQKLIGQKTDLVPLPELFGETLLLNTSFQARVTDEYCVEALLATDNKKQAELLSTMSALGNSVVVVPGDSGVKVHIHTRDPLELRNKLSLIGKVLDWSDEAMDTTLKAGKAKSFARNRIRIISDAAGSLPLDLARDNGIILLDSYILCHNQAQPESLFLPDQLYALMNEGSRVSTAQASNNERHLHYQAALDQYDKLLYLCTGAAFTGNYAIATEWQKDNDPHGQFTVIDTGAASGKLAIIALLTARLAEEGVSAEKVNAYADKLSRRAEEFVFIYELKYLVAGGRVSKAKGFFGDLLHMKPVITPTFDGVRKVAVLRNREAQLDFALEKLEQQQDAGTALLVLLQYTDNREWLGTVVEPQVRRQLPEAEILLVPLSLTSGVHMGPGTWSVAFAVSKECTC